MKGSNHTDNSHLPQPCRGGRMDVKRLSRQLGLERLPELSSISKAQYDLEWCLKFSILPPTYDPSFYRKQISMESLPLPSQFQAFSFPPPTSTLETWKRQSRKAVNSFWACALHLCWCPTISRAKQVEKAIFTLYTESDNDVLSDWLSSQEAWALTHAWKKWALNAAILILGVLHSPPISIEIFAIAFAHTAPSVFH